MILTQGQQTVLQAFAEAKFGLDDTALSVYVHHVSDVSMSSSGIRSRRVELARKGLIKVSGTHRLKSGRRAAIHELTYRGRQAVARQNKLARKAAKAAA